MKLRIYLRSGQVAEVESIDRMNVRSYIKELVELKKSPVHDDPNKVFAWLCGQNQQGYQWGFWDVVGIQEIE